MIGVAMLVYQMVKIILTIQVNNRWKQKLPNGSHETGVTGLSTPILDYVIQQQ